MMVENAAIATMGKIKPWEAFTNWLGTAAKTFNPVGGEGSALDLHFRMGPLAQTITDPRFARRCPHRGGHVQHRQQAAERLGATAKKRSAATLTSIAARARRSDQGAARAADHDH